MCKEKPSQVCGSRLGLGPRNAIIWWDIGTLLGLRDDNLEPISNKIRINWERQNAFLESVTRCHPQRGAYIISKSLRLPTEVVNFMRYGPTKWSLSLLCKPIPRGGNLVHVAGSCASTSLLSWCVWSVSWRPCLYQVKSNSKKTKAKTTNFQ